MTINTKHFEEKLKEEKTRLERELNSLGRKLDNNGDWVAVPEEEVDDFFADKNENADHVEEFQERVATLSELEKEYTNVIKALARIEDKTYGICEVSGEEIEEERLEANPAANTCIAHMNQ